MKIDLEKYLTYEIKKGPVKRRGFITQKHGWLSVWILADMLYEQMKFFDSIAFMKVNENVEVPPIAPASICAFASG